MKNKCPACGMDMEFHGEFCTVGGSFTEPSGSVPTMLDVLIAIEVEPELPGTIPEELFEVIRDDREAMAETLRVAVRQTKAGILRRVAKLYSPQ